MNKLLLTVLALAGIGTATAQVKIAVIDTQKAMTQTEDIKKAQAELEAKFKPRQEAAAKLQKDLELLQAQLQSGKLSQEGAQEVQADGQRKQRELQRVQDDLQADVDHDRAGLHPVPADHLRASNRGDEDVRLAA